MKNIIVKPENFSDEENFLKFLQKAIELNRLPKLEECQISKTTYFKAKKFYETYVNFIVFIIEMMNEVKSDIEVKPVLPDFEIAKLNEKMKNKTGFNQVKLDNEVKPGKTSQENNDKMQELYETLQTELSTFNEVKEFLSKLDKATITVTSFEKMAYEQKEKEANSKVEQLEKVAFENNNLNLKCQNLTKELERSKGSFDRLYEKFNELVKKNKELEKSNENLKKENELLEMRVNLGV